MGFFSDLKEDLTQAVNELLPEAEDLDVPAPGEASAAEEAVMPAEEPASGDEPIREPEQSLAGLSLEEMLANIDSVQLPEEDTAEPEAETASETEEPVADYEPLTEQPEENTEVPAEPETETEETLAEPEPVIPELAEPEPEPEIPVVTEETVAEEPVPEEPVTEEPVPEEPAADEPLSDGAIPIAPLIEPELEPQPAAEDAEPLETDPEPDTQYEESHKGAEKMETNAEAEQEKMMTDETAIITEGMEITGDISSTGSLDVTGSVNGNIDILGKLNITGLVNGNSKASEVYAEGAKINGEVVSEGAVKIGEDSVIIGNITATYAVVAGAVKGDIDVHGPVLLDSTAIVMGNIRSKSVQINNGAVIEGMCSQCYADVSPTHFFDDYQPKAGKNKSKNN